MTASWIPGFLRPKIGRLHQYQPRPLTVQPWDAAAADFELPAVSLVTPSFGQGRFLERTILSVLDQNYPALEYFVQDGGSDDETAGVLKRHESRLAGWAMEADTGQSQAINRAFSRSHGEIMAWLNSDDLLLPGAVQSVVHFFQQHPEVDVVYGDRLLIDEQDREVGRWVLPGHDSALLSWLDCIPQETVFWRRRVWDRAGGRVDESFRFAMDWELLLRFRESGAVFAHLPRFLGAFRVHEAQKTNAAIEAVGLEEMNVLRKQALGRVPGRLAFLRAIAPYVGRHMIADWKYAARRQAGSSSHRSHV
jgi:glycosyltransferase involved in cell wall biosynthesis